MYKGFFGLKENPFNVNPDPRYMFLTKQIEEALSGLTYGIQTKKGILTLTGEVGTGKTTLVNRLLDWLNTQRTRTAFLFNSRMNSTQLFDFVLSEFEIACDSSSKSQPLTKEEPHAYVLERLRIAGAATNGQPIFSPQAMDTMHLYSMGVPRVINLLCEHALINAYVEHQRPISSKIIEDVAREFQLDEVDPTAPPESLRTSADILNSEMFIQNLGEALSRFRMGPSPSNLRERKYKA